MNKTISNFEIFKNFFSAILPETLCAVRQRNRRLRKPKPNSPQKKGDKLGKIEKKLKDLIPESNRLIYWSI